MGKVAQVSDAVLGMVMVWVFGTDKPALAVINPAHDKVPKSISDETLIPPEKVAKFENVFAPRIVCAVVVSTAAD